MLVPPSSDQTLEQQLGTQREALSVFSTQNNVQNSRWAWSKAENCNSKASCNETPLPRSCIFLRSPLISCCTSSADVGELLVGQPVFSDRDLGDQQEDLFPYPQTP